MAATYKEYDLSSLDQIIDRNYTTFLWCFRMPRNVDVYETFANFQRAVSMAATEVPLVAGRLVTAGDPKMGLLKIKVTERDGVPVTMNNLTSGPDGEPYRWKHGSFEDLARRNFPNAALNDIVIRFAGLPPAVNAPPLMINITFIDGGAFMYSAKSHTWCDASAGTFVFSRIAAHMKCICEGTTSQIKRLPESDFDRTRLSTAPEMELPIPVPDDDDLEEDADARIDWVFSTWYISRQGMAELKKYASPKEGFISTSDALSSLMLRSFCNSNKMKENDQEICKAAFAVDFRSRMKPKMSPTYIGNAATVIEVGLEAEEVCAPGQEGLSQIASTVRESITNWDADSELEMQVGMLNEAKKLTHAQRRAARKLFAGPDILFADHTKIPLYQWDWGVWGKIERLRELPQWGREAPTCPVINIYPLDRDGGAEIKTTLELHTLNGMVADPELQKWLQLRDMGIYESGRPISDSKL